MGAQKVALSYGSADTRQCSVQLYTQLCKGTICIQTNVSMPLSDMMTLKTVSIHEKQYHWWGQGYLGQQSHSTALSRT